MTVEEMRKRIEEECDSHDTNWCHNKCPLKGKPFCYFVSDNRIIKKKL